MIRINPPVETPLLVRGAFWIVIVTGIAILRSTESSPAWQPIFGAVCGAFVGIGVHWIMAPEFFRDPPSTQN